MIFGIIEDEVCIETMLFNTVEDAMAFDIRLIKVDDEFGVGDIFDGDKWSHPVKTKEERIEEIDNELKEIDEQGVTRHLENQIDASGTYNTLYETTKQLIDKKRELRLERQNLINS